jgi:mono/diheme cytochrome c family protein
MRKTVTCMFGIALLAGFFLSSYVGSDEIDQGKTLYDAQCKICHGTSGNGKGQAGAALNPAPADFTNPEFWKQPDIDQLIENTILNGHGPMPAFRMKPDQLQAIIDYMKHAFK